RHGSRYHNKPSIYDAPYLILAAADSVGKLTPLGRDVMQRLDRIRRDARNHWGELTSLGAEQHRQIMTRMYERFPEVFADGADIDARSTTVVRCIMSMEYALQQLNVLNPRLNIHHNATHRDMYYLNQQDSRLFNMKMDSTSQRLYTAFAQKYEQNDRLARSLFSDTAYIRQHVDASRLNYTLFKVASNIQSTDMRRSVTLYDVFTDDEVYRNWRKENAWWYVAFGGSTVNGGLQPYTQRNLLRHLISDADEHIAGTKPGASLRYGHETIIMPLTCLLDINGYGLATADLESLDRRGWANYRIFPMASNIQMVFYRRNDTDRDVLFKILLNEQEATLPLKAVDGPYYRWADFKAYYLKKLEDYEKRETVRSEK
ncbi:MAG: histidine-type phosphatase, partial [Prevotella sp.]|nr:histidine-type phosphatase [Prevotella sp.]